MALYYEAGISMSAHREILGMKHFDVIDRTMECCVKVGSHKFDIKPHLILTRKVENKMKFQHDIYLN